MNGQATVDQAVVLLIAFFALIAAMAAIATGIANYFDAKTNQARRDLARPYDREADR